MDNLELQVNEAINAFAASNDPNELEQIKARFLGKNGFISEAMKSLGKLPSEQRKSFGETLNIAKQKIEQALKQRRSDLKEIELAIKLQNETIDISLPGRTRHRGSIHPVMQTQQRVEELFASIGFEVADGPEIETDYYNFTALNTPENHPARSMHDTFYLLDESGEIAKDVLLRTHTSPIQARYMEAHVKKFANQSTISDNQLLPDIKIIAPGRVYRVDSDATHSPMFHQLEGLWVSSQISFADLKGVIVDFLQKFFANDQLNVRFRPSFFPFTEPSAEIDIAFMSGEKKGNWLEVLGCGMVHPNVLKMSGINPELYTGFAFGLGLDRLTMLRYGINDLRLLFDGDLRFLRQFVN